MKALVLLSFSTLIFVTSCANHYFSVEGESVHLYLKAPKADAVYFSSSLDGYTLHQTQKIDSGRAWDITAPAGKEFRYFYVVDGRVYLPSCRFKEKDDFGSENCIFIPGM